MSFRYAWGNVLGGCDKAVVADSAYARRMTSPLAWMSARMFRIFYQVRWNRGHGCGLNITWPVLSKMSDRSYFGVYGLTGNVSEWTADCFSDKYFRAGVNYRDPANLDPKCCWKVVKGHNWLYPLELGSLSFRERAHATDVVTKGSMRTGSLLGFRCARSSPLPGVRVTKPEQNLVCPSNQVTPTTPP